ncbi:hypothetical protein GCM10010964_13600 [Caldovatus sediminis]|uniref:Translocation and assembly module TamB C-terminal domain-containing protein n=1 Tax=Caldovatus sediminis TaxID=2041189 RepID=A0A8J2ZAC0_9PROT|nr:translocation/assembly module TamB domain-containing protein [Caldovatus sediminis]GGG26971.1 hypothetical protein GCM10010964_13600 [Caldovatus sediminis]
MRRIGRNLRRAGLLVLVALAAASALAQTEQTREPFWAGALRLAARQVPGLGIEGLGGSLTRPEAARVTLSDAHGVWLTLERVRLVLDRAAVLRGHLHLEALTAERGILARLPATPPPDPTAPPAPNAGPLLRIPDLPIGVRVDGLAAARLELGEAVLGAPAVLALEGRVALVGGALDAAFAAHRLDQAGEFALRLALDLRADRLEAALRLHEPPGGLAPRALGLPDQPAEIALSLDGPAGAGARLDLRAALGAEVSLAATGTVRLQADGALGATIEGEVAAAPLLPPALAPLLAGPSPTRFALDGDLSAARELALRRLALDAAAGQAEAAGTVDLVAGTATLRLGVTVAGAAPFAALLAPLDLAWRGARGEARLEGPLAAPQIELDLALEGFAAPGIPGLGEALGPAPRLRLAATLPEVLHRLEVLGDHARIEGSGRIAAPLDLRVVFALAGSEPFDALLPIALSWRAVRAEARVTGGIGQPEVMLEAAAEGFDSAAAPLAALLGPAPRLRLAAALPETVRELRLDGAQAAFEADGRVGDRLDLRFALALPDLAALQPEVAGALRVAGTATGPLADPRLGFEARAEDPLLISGQRLEAPRLEAVVENPATALRLRAALDGRLAGLPLRIALRGGAAPDARFRLDEAEARLGPGQARAAGAFDPASGLFDGTVRAEATDLTPFAELIGDPSLAGRLRLEARLAPRRVERRERPLQGFDTRLEAQALRVAGVAAGGRLVAEGTPESMGLALQGLAAGIGLAAQGRLDALPDQDARRLDLASLEIRHAGQTLRLAARPARVVLRGDGGVVLATPLALVGPRGARIRASGAWGPDRADLRATLTAVPAGLAAALATGEEQPVVGTLSGELRASGAVAQPEVAASLRVAGLRADTPWGRTLPAAEIRARATLGPDGAARLAAEARAGAARLSATAGLPQGFGADAPLAATLQGNAELGELLAPLLAPGADRATGRLAAELRAEGTLGVPRLSGRATLAGGEYRNLLYGVRVSNLDGSLRADGTRLVLERLQGTTPGGGRIAASGTLDLGEPGLPVEARVSARNARPLASDRYDVLLDAELGLAGALAEAARLAGTVRIERAEIRLPEALPARIRTLDVQERGGPPPGTVRAQQAARAAVPEAAATAPPPIALALVLEAPRAVFVRGRGLDAELGGRLGIGGTLADPQVEGELRLQRGTFLMLTRSLAFERGALRFVPGVLAPELDFLASARVRGDTLRVAIEGTAEAPQVTFSSTPELPEEEVAARLLFGRPAGGLSPFELVRLADALAGATGIGPAEGAAGGVLERLRRGLGLDRLAVGAEPEIGRRETGPAAPTLEAGRYVAEGVYLGLRQGTDASAAPRVAVEIELRPRLKLEAETGGGAGGSGPDSGSRVGLSYEFEY